MEKDHNSDREKASDKLSLDSIIKVTAIGGWKKSYYGDRGPRLGLQIKQPCSALGGLDSIDVIMWSERVPSGESSKLESSKPLIAKQEQYGKSMKSWTSCMMVSNPQGNAQEPYIFRAKTIKEIDSWLSVLSSSSTTATKSGWLWIKPKDEKRWLSLNGGRLTMFATEGARKPICCWKNVKKIKPQAYEHRIKLYRHREWQTVVTNKFQSGFHGDQIMCARVLPPRRHALRAKSTQWRSPVFLVKTCNRHAPRRKAAKAKRLQLLAERNRTVGCTDIAVKGSSVPIPNQTVSPNTPTTVQDQATVTSGVTAGHEEAKVERSRAAKKLRTYQSRKRGLGKSNANKDVRASKLFLVCECDWRECDSQCMHMISIPGSFEELCGVAKRRFDIPTVHLRVKDQTDLGDMVELQNENDYWVFVQHALGSKGPVTVVASDTLCKQITGDEDGLHSMWFRQNSSNCILRKKLRKSASERSLGSLGSLDSLLDEVTADDFDCGVFCNADDTDANAASRIGADLLRLSATLDIRADDDAPPRPPPSLAAMVHAHLDHAALKEARMMDQQKREQKEKSLADSRVTIVSDHRFGRNSFDGMGDPHSGFTSLNLAGMTSNFSNTSLVSLISED